MIHTPADIYYYIRTEFDYVKCDSRLAAYGAVVLQRFEFNNRDIKIEVPLQHFRQTSNPKKSRDQCVWREACSLRFTFVRLDYFLAVSELPQGFFHPKI